MTLKLLNDRLVYVADSLMLARVNKSLMIVNHFIHIMQLQIISNC